MLCFIELTPPVLGGLINQRKLPFFGAGDSTGVPKALISPFGQTGIPSRRPIRWIVPRLRDRQRPQPGVVHAGTGQGHCLDWIQESL
jgi:hypothetical protein